MECSTAANWKKRRIYNADAEKYDKRFTESEIPHQSWGVGVLSCMLLSYGAASHTCFVTVSLKCFSPLMAGRLERRASSTAERHLGSANRMFSLRRPPQGEVNVMLAALLT